MNILVTGATGFIGSYLVKALVKEGHHCKCLVRNLKKAKDIFKGFEDIEFVVGDIAETQTLRGIADNVDYVFHLAAIRGHDLPSKKAFDKFRKINVEGLENILKECRHNKEIKKIIYTSSTASYGIVKTAVINENTECHPYTPYQVTKYEGEKLAIEYYKKFKLPIVILKPCMIYGPGFVGDFLAMARVAKLGIYPKIGGGKNLAPSLFIDDFIKGCVAALKKGKSGEIYLLSSAKSYSQDDIVGIFEKFFGRKMFRIFLPIWLAKTIAFVQEIILKMFSRKPLVTVRNISSITTDRILDISHSKTELDFKPQISLEEGLPKTLAWFKQEGLT